MYVLQTWEWVHGADIYGTFQPLGKIKIMWVLKLYLHSSGGKVDSASEREASSGVWMDRASQVKAWYTGAGHKDLRVIFSALAD